MSPTTLSSPVSKELYHLFGFPISHSASPALHNYLFARLGLHDRTYKLTPTMYIGPRMLDDCASEEFGGASVTMPLKVSVASILDLVTDEARAIGAVNTLVQERDEHNGKKIIGTNTDWLGVKNALLHYLEPGCSAIENLICDTPGIVIGGGGAARAAVYALASLKCNPIYLVGRDASELAALVAQFSSFPCIPISDLTHVVNVNIAVGCIPAIPPVTPEEIAADACVRAIFSSPRGSDQKRVFLDMCYKPRTTPLMLHAASAGWTVVSGIEAMLEQGFAQARMWLARSVDPQRSIGLIPHEVEEDARVFIRMMPDIIVSSHEDSESTLRRNEGGGPRAIL